MIFTGIPLAISGGIYALSLRHMQFSMTAAVGFIALGGIALLNGIVLLTFINHLRAQGKSVKDATLEGAKERLRPVLMTGTVVIGGLITSTLLTLFVLPTLYAWFEKDDEKQEKKDGPDRNGNGTSDNGFHRSQPEDHPLVPAPEGILVPAGERS